MERAPSGTIVVYDEDEGIYDERLKLESNVWDRAPARVETGILDASGRPIHRQVKGMGHIGFIHFKE